MHQITFAAGEDEPERVISAFERDALKREILRTQGRLHCRQGYDPLSRLTFMRTDAFAGESGFHDMDFPVETGPVVSKKFGYDLRGELVASEDIFSGIQIYAYDALGRVTAARRARPGHIDRIRRAADTSIAERGAVVRLFSEETFLYDSASNLYSTGTGSHSRLREASPEQRFAAAGKPAELPVIHNRLDAIDDFIYQYDTLGRVVEKRDLESDCRWTYTYDSDNRLLEARLDAPYRVKRTRFSYDALGRRTGSFDGRTQTLFVWDGLRLLREETGARAITYFYEQGGHVPLARVGGRNVFAGDSGSSRLAEPEAVFYYHCNAAGLPEDVTDSEGNLIWRGRYSTWGRLLYEKTTPDAPRGFTQPLRMQGQYDDGVTGLYYNTFRYYDADSGRFATEDPIGLAGGDNLYQYATNPFSWSDPLGMNAAALALGGMGTAGSAAGGSAAFLGPLGVGILIVGSCVYGGFLIYTALDEPAKPEAMEMSKGGKQNVADTGISNKVTARMNEMQDDFNNKNRRCQVLLEMIKNGEINAYLAISTLKAWNCKHSNYSK
jgi:RHS repeat-associated protein